MTLLLAALVVWVAGGVMAVALGRRAALSGAIGTASAVLAGLAGLIAALRVLAGAPTGRLEAAWSVPWGSFSLTLDPLAAVFLAPVCLIGVLGAVYGGAYLRPHSGTHAAGPAALAYNFLLASMTLVTLSSNLLLFLFAWEGMTLASYALVVTEHESRAVRRAGMLYLVASHAATAALLLLFLALAGTGSWGFASLATWRGTAPAGLLFALSLIGFGTKAGVVPFHIWLPDAHSAAPAHVSALMSGVMITMGFYGLARFLPFLGPATVGSAGVLIALGAAGALGAIAHALVQRDVKRILAYSTIENAGLVTLAVGVARLGEASGHANLAVLGWTAALLHLWNHALFKSLLFLGVGAAAQAAQTRDLERWGGILRLWPLAGALLFVGAASIAALPPFNGFVSEWLLLRALFEGALFLGGFARTVMVLGIATLAVTAALALAGITRLVGIGLLGAPRSEAFEHARPPGWEMTAPMAILAGLCLAAGLLPGPLLRALARPVAGIIPGESALVTDSVVGPLGRVGGATIAVVLGLFLLRRALAHRRSARRSVTWDCGYSLPDARMQYTAASLSEPIARQVALLLRTHVRWTGLASLWPTSASWSSQTLDRAVTGFYQPALSRLSDFLTKIRSLQEPRVTTYLRFVVLALLAALALLFFPMAIRP